MSTSATAINPSQPPLSIQWKILAICTAAAMVEGYDMQVVGYVAPVISQEWNLAPGAFGDTFAIGLVGLMLGCLFVAPLADRLGRKTIIVGATLAYGVLVLASAMADDLPTLFWMRFVTGIGLGGALPNIAASAAEGSPAGRRVTTVAILFCGFALGSFIGSLVAAALMGAYGWQSVFIFGGVVSLAMAPVLAIGLPRARAADATPADASQDHDIIPVRSLFRGGRALTTSLLWVVFFMGLMDLYLLASWLPTTINAQGISAEAAAIITGLMQIGGITGALILSPIVDRYGPVPALPIAYIFAALCILAIGFTGSSILLTTLAVVGAGFGIVGCQNSDNGFAAKLYPKRMRGTGVGWALGVGRLGAILGPFIFGRALAARVEVETIFMFGAVPALIAAAAYFTMGRINPTTVD